MGAAVLMQVKVLAMAGLTVVVSTVFRDPMAGCNASQGSVAVMAGDAAVMDLDVNCIDQQGCRIRVTGSTLGMELNRLGSDMLSCGVLVVVEVCAMASCTGVGTAKTWIKVAMVLS